MRLKRSQQVLCALAFFLFGALPDWALTPHLVKDITPTGEGVGSDPELLLALDGGVSVWKAYGGPEQPVWRTDGSEAGTYPLLTRVLDEESYDRFAPLAQAGDRGFFVRWEEFPFLSEIWVTGGTPGNTFLVTASATLVPDKPQALWLPSRGILLFRAGDAGTGQELWRSDGTPGGTYRVADLRPGPQGSEPSELTEFGGRVYFRADDGSHGSALWSTDGTAAGTRLVRSAPPGAKVPLAPSGLTAVGSRLVFFGSSASAGREPWASDGTSKGTQPLGNFVPGAEGLTVGKSVVIGRRLWFVAADRVRGEELWITDGTSPGTRRLTDFPRANAFSAVTFQRLPPASLAGRFVFPVNDGIHGEELWVSNGTPAGTQLLRESIPGPGGFILPGTIFRGRLYYAASDSTRGNEPWSTDGTAAGTRLVRDICPGACSSYPNRFALFGGGLYFLADAGENHYDIWRTDGQRTLRVSDLEASPDTFAVPSPGGLVFVQNEKATGRELWCTNGTGAGARILRDIYTATEGGSILDRLQDVGGTLWFVSGNPQRSLWKSDGTEAGTILAHTFEDGARVEDSGFVEANGLVFFGLSSRSGTSLWRTDGTDSGTFQVSPEELRVRSGQRFVAAGGNLFFIGTDTDGAELWKSDGTAEGTIRLTEQGEPNGSDPGDLTAFAGRVFFSAGQSFHHTLWSSDGTPAATQEEVDLDLRGILGVHAGRLWLLAEDDEHGTELWSTDGTPGGTRFLADLAPGNSSFLPNVFISAGDKMFLSVLATSREFGLWVSDGTAAGTRKIGPAPIFGDPERGFALLGNQLFYHAMHGDKIWASDGTAAGTRIVADVPHTGNPIALAAFGGQVFFTKRLKLLRTDGTAAGVFPVALPPGTGWVYYLTASGGRLFFQAYDYLHGSELWALEP